LRALNEIIPPASCDREGTEEEEEEERRRRAWFPRRRRLRDLCAPVRLLSQTVFEQLSDLYGATFLSDLYGATFLSDLFWATFLSDPCSATIINRHGND